MSRPAKAVLTIELALLGFLRRQPLHAYAIHHQLLHSAGLGTLWPLKQGSLYALLRKLEQVGYVSATFHPQDSRAPRRLLELTEAGTRAFAHWLRQPITPSNAVQPELFAKLFFACEGGSCNPLMEDKDTV